MGTAELMAENLNDYNEQRKKIQKRGKKADSRPEFEKSFGWLLNSKRSQAHVEMILSFVKIVLLQIQNGIVSYNHALCVEK
jgi:hypothetical protein